MKIPELLAPAGSLEKAKIAFKYGADAVYAGTAKLSLRTRSEINDDSLEETIKYAHSIGKKVYVAINIYAMDEDYNEIEKEVRRLDSLHADAIIASDVGVVDTIRRVAPNMDIHISTQANTVSLHSANFWEKYGAKRVILARELSKDRIKYMMENKSDNLEVEMFIHGAICFAYSGRCYLSKYLAGRCANQGDCAQSCRWKYNITATEVNNKDSVINIDYDDKGTYLFSSKDMCLINQIPVIVDMGVESLKIEGRLKTEYYLATVVKTYRNAIDEYVKLKKENRANEYDATKYLKELKKVKTRGLSEFYFTDSNNQDIHDFGGQNENVEYEFAGVVNTKLDSNLYDLEIRNKLTIGDEIEILDSDREGFRTFKINKLFDIDTNEEIDVVNPGVKGQRVIIEIPFDDVLEKTILRRKK